MSIAVINATILFRDVINSISINNAYRSGIGREYFETAYFALAQQLVCPLKLLAGAGGTLTDGRRSTNGTESRQQQQFRQNTSCGRLSSTNLYNWRLIKHLENLVTIINWNVEKMITISECS